MTDARAALAQYREAIKAAGDAMERNDGATFSANTTKAQEFLRQARSAFDEAQAARSDDPEVLRDYSVALISSGDFDLAAKALQRAATFQPDDATLWLMLGRALAQLGEPRAQETVKALRHAIDLDTAGVATADAYVLLADVYRQRKLFDLSRGYIDAALAVDPNHVKAKFMLALAKIRDGAILDASNALEQPGAVPPDQAQRLSALLSEAIEGFQSTHKIFEDTAANHIAYAKLLFRAGQPQEALAAAERSAVLDPNNYATWNFVGDLSSQFNRTDRAKEAYQKSLALKPDQPRTQEILNALNASAPVTPAAAAPAAAPSTAPEPPVSATPPPTPPS